MLIQGRTSANEKIAALALALFAVVGVVAIVHHPTLVVREPREALAGIVRLASLDRIVHGSLIGMIAALVFALTIFSIRCGIERASTLAALVSYGLGSVMNTCAALLDGFVLPDIAHRYAEASPPDVSIATAMLFGLFSAIQEFTKVGLVMTSAGIVLWSFGFVRLPRDRPTAILGAVCGVAALLLVVVGGPLTPRTLLPIVALQAVWYVAIAGWLLSSGVKTRDG
jgi:hypothetical protein